MASRVEVTYVLNDRISRKAERLQQKLDKLEKTLAKIDKNTSSIGKNKGIQIYADKAGGASDKLSKKLDKLDSAMSKIGKSTDVSSRSVDNLNMKLIDQAIALDVNVKAMSASTDAAKIQRRELNALRTETRDLKLEMNGLTMAEAQLTRNMQTKNKAAATQRARLKDVASATSQATRAQNNYNRSAQRQSKILEKLRDIQDRDGAFLQGMSAGAFQYELMKKITAMMPLIGVGIGGIASMAASATTAVGGLIGAVFRLSGAMALLPGTYAAGGLLAGAVAGVNANIFKPALEGAKELEKINQRIGEANQTLSDARSKANGATTPAGSASAIKGVEAAERNITKLRGEQAKIANTMPPKAKELESAIEGVKGEWQSAWFGKGGENAIKAIDSAVAGMEQLTSVMQKPMFQTAIADMVGLFTQMVDTGTRLSKNPFFVRGLRGAFGSSMTNAETLLKIAENLAPVTTNIAKNAADITGETLLDVMTWSDTYTEAEKIAEVTEKTRKWMKEGADSLKTWATTLTSIVGSLNKITKPMGKVTEQWAAGRAAEFKSFSQRVTATPQGPTPTGAPLPSKLDTFNKNSAVVAEGFGAIFDAVVNVVGTIGSDPAAAKETSIFLKTLASGIESLGGYSLKAMKEVGPELNGLFKALGDSFSGVGKGTIPAMKLVVGLSRNLVETVNSIPGSEKAVAGIGAVTILLTTLGALVGTAAALTGPARKGVKSIGSMFGKFGERGTPKKPMHVFVQNPGGVTPVVDPPGKKKGRVRGALGKIGGKLKGLGKFGLLAGLGVGSGLGKAGGAARGASRAASRGVAGAARVGGAIGKRAVPVLGTALLLNEAATLVDNTLGDKIFGDPKKRAKAQKEAEKSVATTYDAMTNTTKLKGAVLAKTNDQAGRAAFLPFQTWGAKSISLMNQLSYAAQPAGSSPVPGSTTSVPGQAQRGRNPGTGDSNRPAAGGGGATAGLSSAMGPAVNLATKLGGTITSGFRPGAITSSGLPSDHSTGNAVDVGGSPALMSRIAMAANALPGVKQVIYSPVGWSRNGGTFSPVTDGAVKANHYDHVHIAMGGSGKGGTMPGAGGVSPALGKFPNTKIGRAMQGMAMRAKAGVDARLTAGGDPSAYGAGAAGSGGGVGSMIARAATLYGASAGGLMRVAMAESSMDPNASNNWDSNAQAGIPSRGLFQFIEPTFNSMSSQAMAANPSAWAGVNRNWMDPMAQSLTAAWAFSNGQGSHWATQAQYGAGDSNRPAARGSAGPSAGSSPTRRPRRAPARRSAPRGRSGGGTYVNTTIVVQGALFMNQEGVKQLASAVGGEVANRVIAASPNASTERDI